MPLPDIVSLDRNSAKHLLSRVEFVAAESRVELLSGMPLERAVDFLLNETRQAPMPTRPAWVVEPWVNTERRYADTTADEFRQMHGSTNQRYASEIVDLRAWWLNELVTTPAPLREVMTLFWHGHFASSIEKVLIPQAMYCQNNMQRVHCLGNFRELLLEMTRDPAMLIYLDLERSDQASPNENYARELYELFALGIGNYSQTDISETARALSGLVLDTAPTVAKSSRPTDPETNLRFLRDGITTRLELSLHDEGVKTVLGRSGNFGADEIVDITLVQPACAHFLAGKLIAYFGASDPRQELQVRMAGSFRYNDNDISAMVRVLLTSPEFYADQSRAHLIKSPLALVVGATRQMSLRVQQTAGLFQYLAAMGQEMFNPPNVKGWPGGEAWIGAGTLALRYHLQNIVLDSQQPPGMNPMGRERGRPMPLPKDPVERKAFLARLSSPRPSRDASIMGGVMMNESGRPGSEIFTPAFDVDFSLDRMFGGQMPESTTEIVDQVFNLLLANTPTPELCDAVRNATEREPDRESKAIAAVRTILMSPEYQLC